MVEVAPPFRLDLTVWALRRRALNQIDRWDGTCWRRTVFADDAAVELSVTQIGVWTRRACVLISPGASRAFRTSGSAKFCIGCSGRHRPGAILQDGGRDPRLSALVVRFRGMRPPRFPTIFEALMNGIACQQLSLRPG